MVRWPQPVVHNGYSKNVHDSVDRIWSNSRENNRPTLVFFVFMIQFYYFLMDQIDKKVVNTIFFSRLTNCLKSFSLLFSIIV